MISSPSISYTFTKSVPAVVSNVLNLIPTLPPSHAIDQHSVDDVCVLKVPELGSDVVVGQDGVKLKAAGFLSIAIGGAAMLHPHVYRKPPHPPR